MYLPFEYFAFMKEHRSFDFRPDLSDGHQFDPLIVPSVPFFTAAWSVRRELSFIKNLLVKTAILTSSSKPFVVNFIFKNNSILNL